MQAWIYAEGTRRPDMVGFDRSSEFGSTRTYEADESFHDSRWLLTARWKIRVCPVPWADWGWKRVGGVCEMGWPVQQATYLAQYVGPTDDGLEEWQVSQEWARSSPGASDPVWSFPFLVWYQDGLGNAYYDDDDGRDYTLRWPAGRADE